MKPVVYTANLDEPSNKMVNVSNKGSEKWHGCLFGVEHMVFLVYGPFLPDDLLSSDNSTRWKAPFRATQFFSRHSLFRDFLEETGNGWPVARSHKICLCNLFIICKFLKNSKLRKFIKFNAWTSIRRKMISGLESLWTGTHCPWYC